MTSLKAQNDVENIVTGLDPQADTDAQFGGKEARDALERSLLRKLDIRMGILVLIYILNYVRSTESVSVLQQKPTLNLDRSQ
jgi:hypothetical protein